MASRRLAVLQQHLGGLRAQDEDGTELERQATSAAATTMGPPVRRCLPSPAAASSSALPRFPPCPYCMHALFVVLLLHGMQLTCFRQQSSVHVLPACLACKPAPHFSHPGRSTPCLACRRTRCLTS